MHIANCPKCRAKLELKRVGKCEYLVCHNDRLRWLFAVSGKMQAMVDEKPGDANLLATYADMRTEPIFKNRKMKKAIVIKQSCQNKQACPCGRFENPGTPYWLFVEGDSQAMCFDCCKEYEPEMLAMCEAQNSAFWKAYSLLTGKETGEPEAKKYQNNENPF